MTTWIFLFSAVAIAEQLVGSTCASTYTTFYHGPQVHPAVPGEAHFVDAIELEEAGKSQLEGDTTPNEHSGWYPQRYADHTSRYHGPIAVPVVLPNGHIADTHEVATAKEAHLAAHEKAKALWAGKYNDDSYYASNYGGHHYGYTGVAVSQGHEVYNTPYYGPLANPVVLPSGYLADTHEVAIAKVKHLNAVQESKAAAKDSEGNHYAMGYYYRHGNSAGYAYGAEHHEHIPVVLPNGHIADTHAVAAAKEAHLTAVALAEAKEYSGTGHAADYDAESSGYDRFHYGSFSEPSVHFEYIHEPTSEEHHLNTLEDRNHPTSIWISNYIQHY